VGGQCLWPRARCLRMRPRGRPRHSHSRTAAAPFEAEQRQYGTDQRQYFRYGHVPACVPVTRGRQDQHSTQRQHLGMGPCLCPCLGRQRQLSAAAASPPAHVSRPHALAGRDMAYSKSRAPLSQRPAGKGSLLTAWCPVPSSPPDTADQQPLSNARSVCGFPLPFPLNVGTWDEFFQPDPCFSRCLVGQGALQRQFVLPRRMMRVDARM
jgi:hypothetical protein